MKNFTKRIYIPFLLTLIFPLGVSAQLSGSYSVPGTFTSLAAAINSLNAGGASGPTTINLAAGYTETAVFGGYQLNSYSFPITFRKNGAGANPLLVAYAGGVGTPTDATVQDGIWRFVGSDNITIDGIDLLDPNTGGTAMMEYGYGFFKANSFNGCQNNTIKNCNISLNNLNQISGSFGADHGGSKGIYLSCATTTFYTQSANVSTLPATNSYNKFYSNYIQNCHIGISMPGYDSQGYLPSCDQLNDVGGFSAATSNTIVNFGGGNTSTYCAGIAAGYQYSLNVSNNVLNNNTGSGVNPIGDLYGILATYHSAANASINNNTVTLTLPVHTSTIFLYMAKVQGISCRATTTIASITQTANVSINNNIFPSFSVAYQGISPNAALIYISMNPVVTSISNNLMQNINVSGNTEFNAIHCEVSSTCTINSNTIANVTTSTSSNFVYQSGILCNAIRGFVVQNLITNFTNVNPHLGGFVGIKGANNLLFASVVTNTISNLVATGCNGITISSAVNQATFNILGNTVFNFSAPVTTTVTCGAGGIFVAHSGANATATVVGNTIYSLNILALNTPTAAYATLTGIQQSDINSVISNNKIYELNTIPQNSSIYGIRSLSNSYRTSQIANNIITGLECQGSNGGVYGIMNNSYNSVITFNSLYLAGANTGTNCNSYCVFLVGASNGNGLSQLLNNVLVNDIPATGSGTAMTMYCNASVHYGSQSNRNILYTGIPASNRFIARIANNTYSLIASFKSAVFPRDVQTFTENPVFTSTVGAMPNVLMPDPSVLTLIESGAAPITSITVDFAGTTRNANSPDIGAWENNYMGYDRVPPIANASGFTNLPCNNLTNRIFTISISEPGGIAVGSLSPRLYFRVNTGSWSSTQGVLSAGTASNGVWSFTMNYSGSLGSTISYYVLAQDLSSFNNFMVHPYSAGGVFNSVTNVVTHPSPVSNYVLQNYPNINVNSGIVCIGKSFTMTPSGASTYTFSSGSAVVTPTVTSSYTITGTSSSGCISTVAAVSNVTVQAYPTITVSNGSVCRYQSSYTINPLGASTYTYIGGGPVVAPTTPATYTILGASSGGCASTNTVICYVAVNDLPEVDITTSREEICVGETAVLSGVGALNYTFTPGGGPTTTLAVSPTVNTTYTVIGADFNGCTDLGYITQVVYLCESVKEAVGSQLTVKLYPNPGSNVCFIEADVPLVISIVDACGQIVFTTKTEGGLSEINLAHLSKGLYLVKLSNGQNSRTVKYIRE